MSFSTAACEAAVLHVHTTVLKPRPLPTTPPRPKGLTGLRYPPPNLLVTLLPVLVHHLADSAISTLDNYSYRNYCLW